MKKVKEIMEDVEDFHKALDLIAVVCNNYSTKDGYKIESFISDGFVRISVYKEVNYEKNH